MLHSFRERGHAEEQAPLIEGLREILLNGGALHIDDKSHRRVHRNEFAVREFVDGADAEGRRCPSLPHAIGDIDGDPLRIEAERERVAHGRIERAARAVG